MACKLFQCVLFCQPHIRGLTLLSIHRELPGPVQELSCFALKRERLVWQRLPLLYLWRHFDVYVFYGNPRMLSTVVWATLLRLAGRKVIVWGQAHTAGASRPLEELRIAWWKLFDYLFVYTDRDVQLLKNRGFEGKTIIGMNNGLNQSRHELQVKRWRGMRLEQWQKLKGLESRVVLLSCARLEQKNRFDVMIQCMPQLIRSVRNVLWCVIGDGPAAVQLIAHADRLGLDGHVLWLGAIYKEEELAPWFLTSKCCVHPGAIGLTLLHAFGYGLPVITHDNNRNHMPEITALRDGSNGLLYSENVPNALCKKIIELLRDERKLSRMRSSAHQVACTEFNTEIMAARFAQLISRVAP